MAYLGTLANWQSEMHLNLHLLKITWNEAAPPRTVPTWERVLETDSNSSPSSKISKSLLSNSKKTY